MSEKSEVTVTIRMPKALEKRLRRAAEAIAVPGTLANRTSVIVAILSGEFSLADIETSQAVKSISKKGNET